MLNTMARKTKASDKRRVEEAMSKYGITLQDLCLAVLVFHGIPSGDAFSVIYPDLSLVASQRESQYAKLIAARPQVLAFLNALIESESISGATSARQHDLSTKEGLLAALEEEVGNAVDVKQRADILMKIADLRRMKQDEEIGKEKLIHYYLPLRCEQCPAKAAYERLE